MAGLGRKEIGEVPVVIEAEFASSQMKILPVTYHDAPTVSVIVPEPPPLSLIPATRISNVCSCPSQRMGRKGEMSISCSRRSKASNPTMGRHRPGTTPPVKMTGKGH